jgi:hypothetical protein
LLKKLNLITESKKRNKKKPESFDSGFFY